MRKKRKRDVSASAKRFPELAGDEDLGEQVQQRTLEEESAGIARAGREFSEAKRREYTVGYRSSQRSGTEAGVRVCVCYRGGKARKCLANRFV